MHEPDSFILAHFIRTKTKINLKNYSIIFFLVWDNDIIYLNVALDNI